MKKNELKKAGKFILITTETMAKMPQDVGYVITSYLQRD